MASVSFPPTTRDADASSSMTSRQGGADRLVDESNTEVTQGGEIKNMNHVTKLFSAAALLAVFAVPGQEAKGQEFVQGHVPPLFANYYTQGFANQATAEMYVAPVPVPYWVGHTYVTYQPLYPHELMFAHTHKYHNYYDNGRGLNSTKVRYSSAPIRTAVRGLHPIIPRP